MRKLIFFLYFFYSYLTPDHFHLKAQEDFGAREFYNVMYGSYSQNPQFAEEEIVSEMEHVLQVIYRDPQIKNEFLNQRNNFGEGFPLIDVALINQYALVKSFLKEGADINQFSLKEDQLSGDDDSIFTLKKKNTLTHFIVKNERMPNLLEPESIELKIIELLIGKGINISGDRDPSQPDFQTPPLCAAVRAGNILAVMALLSHGAKTNILCSRHPRDDQRSYDLFYWLEHAPIYKKEKDVQEKIKKLLLAPQAEGDDLKMIKKDYSKMIIMAKMQEFMKKDQTLSKKLRRLYQNLSCQVSMLWKKNIFGKKSSSQNPSANLFCDTDQSTLPCQKTLTQENFSLLESLPLELLAQVLDHLPTSEHLAIKRTNKDLSVSIIDHQNHRLAVLWKKLGLEKVRPALEEENEDDTQIIHGVSKRYWYKLLHEMDTQAEMEGLQLIKNLE